MAFTTAPAKAAKAQAAAAAAAATRAATCKVNQDGEEEEMESSLSEINSSGTQSTIVEVHDLEEDPAASIANKKTPLSQQQCATSAVVKPKLAKMTRGLSYTSLWPSARDVVISAASQPNTCNDK